MASFSNITGKVPTLLTSIVAINQINRINLETKMKISNNNNDKKRRRVYWEIQIMYT